MRNFDLAPLYRSAIGFDRLFNLLESNQNQSNGGYPPYNVELVSENHYRITIAVAGFAQNELDITAQDNVLIVRGAHPEEPVCRKTVAGGATGDRQARAVGQQGQASLAKRDVN